MGSSDRPVNFGQTASDYGTHRAGFPASLFDRLEKMGIGLTDRLILDLGTGTGTVARNLAFKGARVTGLDPAEGMIAVARRLDEQAEVSINYVIGRAEKTGFESATFDHVFAGQCWHWFDRQKAADECYRLLSPGGALVLCHFDWIPLQGNVVDATESLIRTHNPDWHMHGGTGLHPEELADMAKAGFTGLETFSYDVEVPYTHEAWRGRIRASAGVAATLSPEQVETFDRDHKTLLEKDFPQNPLHVPHRVFAAVGWKKA